MVLNVYPLPLGLLGGLLCLALASAHAQAPTLTSVVPAANARAVPRNSAVVATFSQPLTAASAAGLKVFSSQRGGLRGGGVATVAGNTLAWAPMAYDFRPGETVQLTVTRAASGAGGALATPWVQQFTTAVGGTGRGAFGSNLTSYNMAATPGSIAAGDLNGDGTPDLAVANADIGTVSLRLSQLPGTFLLAAPDVPTGPGARALVLADVDGDGDLDLLTANAGSGTVSVCQNNGTGAFGSSQTIAGVAQPSALAVGDVDGDGDLDVVVTSGSGTLALPLLNSGTGVFTRGTSSVVGTNPGDAALADLDNDGDLDLLTTNDGSTSVGIRFNDGAGGFGRSASFSTGNGPLRLAVGDVDGDNDPDIVVTCAADNVARVRLNDGAGQFPAGYILPTSAGACALALADIDSDNDLDLLVLSCQDGNIRTWTNDGVGTFSLATSLNANSAANALAVADLDNDGDLDWATANGNSTSANTLVVRRNGGTGPLATTPGTRSAAPAALTASPNPATGPVALALPPAATSAELLDGLGRVVRTVPARAGTATLDVAGLAPGLYLVRAAGQAARLVVE